jgi:hypothetical protein
MKTKDLQLFIFPNSRRKPPTFAEHLPMPYPVSQPKSGACPGSSTDKTSRLYQQNRILEPASSNLTPVTSLTMRKKGFGESAGNPLFQVARIRPREWSSDCRRARFRFPVDILRSLARACNLGDSKYPIYQFSPRVRMELVVNLPRDMDAGFYPSEIMQYALGDAAE